MRGTIGENENVTERARGIVDIVRGKGVESLEGGGHSEEKKKAVEKRAEVVRNAAKLAREQDSLRAKRLKKVLHSRLAGEKMTDLKSVTPETATRRVESGEAQNPKDADEVITPLTRRRKSLSRSSAGTETIGQGGRELFTPPTRNTPRRQRPSA